MKKLRLEKKGIEVLIIRIFSIVSGVACPLIAMFLLDTVILSKSKSLLFKGIAIFIFAYMMDILIDYLSTMLQISWAEEMVAQKRESIYNSILHADTKAIEKNNIGKILSIMSSDIKGICDCKSRYYPFLISDILYMLSICICMLILSFKITVVVLTLFFTLCYVNHKFKKKIENKSLQIQQANDSCMIFLEQSLNMIDTIKTYNREQCYYKRMQNHANVLKDVSINGILFRTRLNSLSTAVISLIQGIIYFWGIYSVFEGNFSAGKIVALIQYFRLVSGPFYEILNVLIEKKNVAPMNKRVMELEEIQPEMNGSLSISSIQEIEFKNVRFEIEKRKILKNLTFTLPRKGVVLLRGENGTGKSTICKMLIGLYNPTEGSIFLNNRDYRDYNIHSIRDRIAYIPQFPDIVNGSLLENIIFSDTLIEERKVSDVIQKTHLERLLSKQKDGLNTIINEKSNLSGGEIQLIAFARALMKSPDVIIMDEPLASLDDRMVEEMCDIINTLSKEILIILISHGRYSLIDISKEIEIVAGELT